MKVVIRGCILLTYLMFWPGGLLGEEETIEIGAIFSLSSWGGEGGTAELNGALMAQDEINSRGGILGKKLELIVEDNHSDLKTTATAFKKLVSIDKVPAILGPNWAEFVEIAAPLAESSKIPLISPSGFKEGLIYNKDYVFTLWPPHSVATRPLAEFIAKRKHKKLTVLISENAYFEGVIAAMQKQLKELGNAELQIMRFTEGTLDYRSVISKIKGSNADALLVLLFGTGDFSNFLKQAKQQGLKLPMYSGNEISFSEAIQKEPSIAEGLIYFDYIIPGGAKFREQYREKFSSQPNFASAQTYDAVFLIKEAIEKCGIESVKIRKCLERVSYQGVSGRIRFNEGGVITGVKDNTYLLKVKGGKFTKL